MFVFWNDRIIPKSDACLSPDDRGFLFGDGVYEVVRAVNGRLFQAEPHWARLRHGLAELRIAVAEEHLARLDHVATELLRRNGHDRGEATVYLQITRGAAYPRTHAFPKATVAPTVYLTTTPFEPHRRWLDEGVAAVTAVDLRWRRCDIKSVNLLPNVLAKQMAVERGAYEAVLVREGYAVEGASSNVFVVRDGTLRTHPLGPDILAGITRALVVELARHIGIPVEERPIPVDELVAADEVFLTGTTTDVMPVVRLDDRVIGDGRPGPLTRRLQQVYFDRLYAAPVAAA